MWHRDTLRFHSADIIPGLYISFWAAACGSRIQRFPLPVSCFRFRTIIADVVASGVAVLCGCGFAGLVTHFWVTLPETLMCVGTVCVYSCFYWQTHKIRLNLLLTRRTPLGFSVPFPARVLYPGGVRFGCLGFCLSFRLLKYLWASNPWNAVCLYLCCYFAASWALNWVGPHTATPERSWSFTWVEILGLPL